MIDRIVKLIGSMVYFACREIIDILFFKKIGGNRHRWVILMYHSVGDQHKENFEKHMIYLLKKGKPITKFDSGQIGKKSCCITVTFDDGLCSTIRNALPVLEKHNIPSIMFLPSDYLGKKAEWMTDEYEQYKNDFVMTIEELKAVSSRAFIEIGSHSKRHVFLDSLDAKAKNDEIEGSKLDLEDIIERKIDLFSAPFGSYDKDCIEIAKRAGYKRFFLNIPTGYNEKPNEFINGRIDISPEDWTLEYKLKINGAYQWLHAAIQFKRKILKLKNQFIE